MRNLRNNTHILIRSLKVLRDHARALMVRIHEDPHLFSEELSQAVQHKTRQIEGMILSLEHVDWVQGRQPFEDLYLIYKTFRKDLHALDRTWARMQHHETLPGILAKTPESHPDVESIEVI